MEIDELLKKLNEFVASGGKIDATDILINAVNHGKALMSFRIFNQGLDAQGDSLGRYTGKKKIKDGLTPYERKRVVAGRQVGFKDLEFFGTLRRSIVTAENYNKVECVFSSDKEADIARWQERQVGNIRATGSAKSGANDAPIFKLSDSEYEETIRVANDGLKQLYDRLFGITTGV